MVKHFECICESGSDVYKVHVPATSRAAAEKWISDGAGMTPILTRAGGRNASDPISADCIAAALRSAYFGQMEIDLIVRTLTHFTDFVR